MFKQLIINLFGLRVKRIGGNELDQWSMSMTHGRQKQTLYTVLTWQPPDIVLVCEVVETIQQEACGLVFSDMYLSLPEATSGPFLF